MSTSKHSGRKVYFVKIPSFESRSGGSKAIRDCEKIFGRFGMIPLNLVEYVFGSSVNSTPQTLFMRVWGMLRRFVKLSIYTLRGTISNKFTQGTVIYQVFSDRYDPIFSLALRLLFMKGKRVLVLHDFNTLLRGTWIDRMRDKFMLKNFTDIIVHTEQMKSFIVEKIKFKGKLYVLGFHDYLIPRESIKSCIIENIKSLQTKFKIAYAGTLTKERCGFLYDLQEKSKGELSYEFHLYGDLRVANLPHFAKWDGAYEPDDLPFVLNEKDMNFGLIWYGNSAEKIDGNLGRYLGYCAPHKASLYIVSGLPIICWSHSAIAKLVELYDVGFAVNSLLDLQESLQQITDEEYLRWKRNVAKLAQKLVSGDNLSKLLNEILS